MSRLYEALRKSEQENQQKGVATSDAPQPTEVLGSVAPAVMTATPMELEAAKTVRPQISAERHLVALADPHSLAAEKFRVLLTRLDNLRGQRELKSVQVTSGVTDEGKTLISANLAVTLARHSQTRILLVEGDLHNPGLHSLFGLNGLKGICQWWGDPKSSITDFVYRLGDLPLWYLPAGGKFEEAAILLQSGRFAETFSQLAGLFDWTIVDSTPLLPMADANIWNRLVDGTLLVVRENVTPINPLKKGLASLDDPKLIGVVLNGASEFDRVSYYDQYYSTHNGAKKNQAKGKAAEVHE
ncbi:MAG TPA: CpsD/CapB family tyrosine-protein kinase [Candidatus Acidoferrales bacterium]|nr:CpsD/CapB family tyrosine-protein kinase [Candidatus Acidoferrales bacterium]